MRDTLTDVPEVNRVLMYCETEPEEDGSTDTFSVVDDSPDGLGFITVSTGVTAGVTLDTADVRRLIGLMAEWLGEQDAKLRIPD